MQEVIEENGGVRVQTARAPILAANAVIATNSPIVDRYALHTKMAPYRTYAMAFTIKQGALPDALYWDTEEPYHYVRLQPGARGKDYVIVGGEDHKTGEADDAREPFRQAGGLGARADPGAARTSRIAGPARSSTRSTTPASSAAIPAASTSMSRPADSGQGMTHGVAGAMINADLITLGKSEWAHVYAPDRKPVAAIGNYLRENATALKNFAEYLTPGEITSLDELKAGQGAILRQGLEQDRGLS